MFPGKDRRYLDDFRTGRMVYLTVPSIGLTVDALADDALLAQHLAMSQAWVDYYRGDTDRPPSRNPQRFEVPDDDRSFRAALGNVRSLFIKAQKGDIVIVGQSDFYEPIFIGEIISDFDVSDVTGIERFSEENVPFRKIRWLSVSQERRHFSEGLSKLLSNRKAIVSVDPLTYGPEIFEAAFGDFIYEKNSRYVFQGPEYRNKAIATIPGMEIISYFCAAFNALELDEISEFSALSISDAIEKYYDEDYLNAFEIEFASPGAYVLAAKAAVLPAFVALMVAAAGSGENLTDLRNAGITNSGRAVAPQSVEANAIEQGVKERYDRVMTSINAGRLAEWKKKHESARKGVGLHIKVKVKK